MRHACVIGQYASFNRFLLLCISLSQLLIFLLCKHVTNCVFTFLSFFLFKKNNIQVSIQRVVCCSHQSHCLRYVSRSNQIAALGYVSRTNQSVVFVLWFERCSSFNEVMGDSERAVRKMESSFRMRNVGFFVFSTCILPRFLRNAILLDR